MSILYAAGEDLDFQNGCIYSINTNSLYFDSSKSRCSITPTRYGVLMKSTVFKNGEITSGWVHTRARMMAGTNGCAGYIGFGKSWTNSGIMLGGNNAGKLYIVKFTNLTESWVVSETGASFPNSETHTLDMQMINYGTNTTINVYVDAVLKITYTGNLAISGVSGFDSVFSFVEPLTHYYGHADLSEIIVADEDTRTMRLKTFALTSDGTTTDWNGTYSTINGITLSDVTPNYSNTADQDQQFNGTDLTGTYAIKAVVTTVRATKSVDSAVGNLAIGYNSGGTVAVGNDLAVPTYHTVLTSIDHINPVTGNQFLQNEINGLQINLRTRL